MTVTGAELAAPATATIWTQPELSSPLAAGVCHMIPYTLDDVLRESIARPMAELPGALAKEVRADTV